MPCGDDFALVSCCFYCHQHNIYQEIPSQCKYIVIGLNWKEEKKRKQILIKTTGELFSLWSWPWWSPVASVTVNCYLSTHYNHLNGLLSCHLLWVFIVQVFLSFSFHSFICSPCDSNVVSSFLSSNYRHKQMFAQRLLKLDNKNTNSLSLSLLLLLIVIRQDYGMNNSTLNLHDSHDNSHWLWSWLPWLLFYTFCSFVTSGNKLLTNFLSFLHLLFRRCFCSLFTSLFAACYIVIVVVFFEWCYVIFLVWLQWWCCTFHPLFLFLVSYFFLSPSSYYALPCCSFNLFPLQLFTWMPWQCFCGCSAEKNNQSLQTTHLFFLSSSLLLNVTDFIDDLQRETRPCNSSYRLSVVSSLSLSFRD